MSYYDEHPGELADEDAYEEYADDGGMEGLVDHWPSQKLSKARRLKMLSKQLQKDMAKIAGEGSVVPASEAKALEYGRLPTGSVQMDLALGGGLPKGRIVEFYGRESHGKTSSMLKAVAAIQKQGGTCALMCSEEFDPGWAALLGVDLTKLLLSRPDSVETMINLVEQMVVSREIQFIGVDSITGFIPLHVLGRSADEPTQGVEARMNGLWARKVVASMAPGDLRDPANQPWCSVVYLNQMRAKMGGRISYDEPSGGWALKHFKSIAVEFRRTDWLNEKGGKAPNTRDIKFGLRIAFTAKKNKTALPFGTGEIDLYFEDAEAAKAGQYDLVKELVTAAIDYEAVRQAGAFYSLQGSKTKYQGKEALVNAIRKKPDVVQVLHAKLPSEFQYYEPPKKAARG